MSADLIGIEIGAGLVRLVVLEQQRTKLVATAFEEVLLPPSDEALPEQALVAAISSMTRGRDCSNVAISIPALRCVFRNFTVGFTTDEQLRQVVKYEAESHLPTTAIEDVIVNYYRTASDTSRTHLLVSVVEKKLVRRVLDIAAQCGIDPLSLDVDLMAAMSSYRFCGVLERPGRVLVVQLDRQTTNIALLIEGQLQFARCLKLGTESLGQPEPRSEDVDESLGDLDISADLQLDFSALERDLAIAGPTLESGAHPALSDAPEGAAARLEARFAERLVQQLRRTLLSARQGAPDALILAGSGADLASVHVALGDQFGVEPEVVDVLASLEVKLGPEASQRAARMPAALGLALKLAGIDEGNVELRQEEFRYAKTFEQLQGALVTASCLLFALVVVCCFQVRRQYRVASREYAQLYHQARQLYEAATGGSIDQLGSLERLDPRHRIGVMVSDLEERRAELTSTDSGTSLDGLEAWLLISRLLRDFERARRGRLRLKALEIEPNRIVLRGEVPELADEQALWAALLALSANTEGVLRPENTSEPGPDGQVIQISYVLPLGDEEE